MITPELKHIKLIVSNDDKRQVIRKLHSLGTVHITETSTDELDDDTSLQEARTVSDLLLSFKYLDRALEPRSPQSIDDLPSLQRTIDEAQTFLNAHLDDVKALHEDIQDLEGRLDDYDEQLSILDDLPEAVKDIENPILFTGEHEERNGVETVQSSQQTYQLITATGTKKARLTKELQDGLRRVDLSFVNTTITEAREELNDEKQRIAKTITEHETKLNNLTAKLSPKRDYLHTVLKAHYDELTLPNKFQANDDITVIEGYCEPNTVNDLTDNIPEATLYEATPDEAPTKLKQDGVNKSFRTVTSMYDTPRYGAFDPTGYISLFYPLFFGFMLADIGYGMLVLLTALLIETQTQTTTKQYTHILTVSGLSTILFGIAFGSFFGELIPAAALWVQPFEESYYLLKASLVLGLIHMNIGWTTNLYQHITQRQPLFKTITNTFPLPIIEAGAILLYYQAYTTGITLLILATALLVKRDGIIGVLGTSDYLGTWFSYARLLALSLATTGIALAVNVIASMMYSIPIIGGITYTAFLIFGHTFNYAVNVLSSTINAARLHYVEFFDLFFQGGGTQFTPFKLP
jgi:V/A-type H+-transporting ATPase subunit I